jgi:GNAT superfamily N-acetyltransferase
MLVRKMNLLFVKVKLIKFMLFRGQFVLLLREILRRLYSDDSFLYLRCDLTKTFKPITEKISIRVRTIRNADVPRLLDLNKKGITTNEFKEQATRLSLLNTNIKTCYVAVTADDNPCHMLWLIRPNENDKMQKYYKGGFPALNPDEVIVEGLFTPDPYRNKGIMTNMLSKIAEMSAESGARWEIALVRYTNIPSLKAFERAGFKSFKIRKDRWRFFSRKFTFFPESEDISIPRSGLGIRLFQRTKTAKPLTLEVAGKRYHSEIMDVSTGDVGIIADGFPFVREGDQSKCIFESNDNIRDPKVVWVKRGERNLRVGLSFM